MKNELLNELIENFQPNILTTREDWLNDRLSGLGGTAASIIKGVNKYQSKADLYSEIMGLEEPSGAELQTIEDINSDTPSEIIDNNLAKWIGNALEDTAIQIYKQRTGFEVFTYKDINPIAVNWSVRHQEKKCLIGSIDAIVFNGRDWGVLEVKTSLGGAANDWNFNTHTFDGVPEYYRYQPIHYVGLHSEFKFADVIVINGTFKKKQHIYHWDRDDLIICDLQELEVQFWNEHILPVVPYEKSDMQTEMFSDGIDYLDGDESDFLDVSELANVRREKNVLTKREEDIVAKIKARLKGKECLFFKGIPILSVSSASKKYFNAKAFQIDNPELYSKYESDNSYTTLKPSKGL